MNVARGEIWRALVPYNDNPVDAKRRPVLVLGFSAHGPTEDSVILVAPITSFGDGGRARNGDVPLLNWRNFGLDRGSYVRARRIWGADPKAFDQSRGCLGKVSEDVMSQVLTEIMPFFS
jgi:mRNA-degrading endonuclease toxin of MazEF toxin-antitoxin module